jgi:lactate dehydrogenase-like 2-hydroxyacid dehydrogenase
MKYSVFLTRRLPEAAERHLAERYELISNADDRPLTRKALTQAVVNYDVLCPTITDRIDLSLLNTAGIRTRLIANFGAGVEHIDLQGARNSGIAVTNTPDALTEATAEIAIMLMLMAARRAGEGERELRAGNWRGWRPTHLLGCGLAGARLGLVGFGRIAQAVAHRATAFGMTVAYHARRPVSSPYNYAVDLHALVANVDMLSFHVPGGAETHHLLDEALVNRLPRGAIVVNTARGTLIDEAALAAALRSGKVAAAGLDVYEHEPAVHPDLVACENAVLLPPSWQRDSRNANRHGDADGTEHRGFRQPTRAAQSCRLACKALRSLPRRSPHPRQEHDLTDHRICSTDTAECREE